MSISSEDSRYGEDKIERTIHHSLIQLDIIANGVNPDDIGGHRNTVTGAE